MSTPSDVRTAWASVFADASITAITSKVYAYDLPITTGTELGQVRHGQEINYFSYLVSYTEQLKAVKQLEQRFRVTVQYFREHNLTGSNYNAAVDALYTVHSTARSVIGSKWSNSIDFYQPPGDPRQPSIVSIDARPVWKIETSFDGVKILDL